MITVQQILNRAYSKSLKNQPGFIADEATELLAQVNRAFRAFYGMAARVNPTFFGTTATMSEASATWVEPTDAESVYYLEQDSDKAEVIVVPIEEQDAEPGELAVYSLGRVYQASSSNPPSGVLNVYYSMAFPEASALGDTIDPSWPDSHNELAVLEIAIFLAIKDGRAEELGGLVGMRNAEVKRFLTRVENQHANLRTRFGPAQAINTSDVWSPRELLLGEAG